MSLRSTPAQMGATLFLMKEELTQMSSTIKQWRQEGIYGSGLVPLEVVSLEPKITRLIGEVDALIRVLSRLGGQPARNPRESIPPLPGE